MEETIKNLQEESSTKKETISKVINRAIDKMMMDDFGINEKAMEVCPNLLSLIDKAIGAAKDGEKEQRENAICFFESLERLGIVKPGTSLDIRDTCYNFNKFLYRNQKSKVFDNNSDYELSTKQHVVEVPTEKGISKEKFEEIIMQQIDKTDSSTPKSVKDLIVKRSWDSYQRNVESKQEDNGNV